MKRIRIRRGKDIVINWPILTNGQATSLSGRDLTLVRKEPNGREAAMDFSFSGNTLSTTFRGRLQTQFGDHVFSLYENYKKNGQTVVDCSDVITLVRSTELEDVPSGTNVGISTVNLTVGQVLIGAKGADADIAGCNAAIASANAAASSANSAAQSASQATTGAEKVNASYDSSTKKITITNRNGVSTHIDLLSDLDLESDEGSELLNNNGY